MAAQFKGVLPYYNTRMRFINQEQITKLSDSFDRQREVIVKMMIEWNSIYLNKSMAYIVLGIDISSRSYQ